MTPTEALNRRLERLRARGCLPGIPSATDDARAHAVAEYRIRLPRKENRDAVVVGAGATDDEAIAEAVARTEVLLDDLDLR